VRERKRERERERGGERTKAKVKLAAKKGEWKAARPQKVCYKF